MFDAPELHDEAGNMIFDGIIPHMLSTLPDILIGIVVVLVLSASMSTLASLVLTSSSTLTLDFLKDNVMKDMSEKKQVRTMQVMVVLLIVVPVVSVLTPKLKKDRVDEIFACYDEKVTITKKRSLEQN